MVSDEAANFVLDRGRAIYAELQQAKAEIERLTAENERLRSLITNDRNRLQSEGDLGMAALLQTYLNAMGSYQQSTRNGTSDDSYIPRI